MTKKVSGKKAGSRRAMRVPFAGRLLIVGFGSIGQGALPLILRHIGIDRSRISIIAADKRGRAIARKERISFAIRPLTKENYVEVLGEYLRKGDFLLNLSVDVSCLDLINYCQAQGILYLDTVIEPWIGIYDNPDIPVTERSNYGLREEVLALKPERIGAPTAVVAHGANPGIVSHFVKQALLNIAKDTRFRFKKPASRGEWAALMRGLGVKAVHIAEYDSQVSRLPRRVGRFENTWSVFGFYAEGVNQPCELGWGTHERYWPSIAHRHPWGCDAAIYLDQPGARTLVRTWTPAHGNFLGRAVTHNESISIADYYTLRDAKGLPVYRPTVHYAYRPCDAALLSLEECFGRNSQLQDDQIVLLDDIVSGMDELGVLLVGHKKNAYWYGSQLTIGQARKLAPYQNATGLQVTAGVLGGMIWALENPRAGIVEADELDFERVMEIIEPYMGSMVGEYTNWTPLQDRPQLFAEDVDETDPWQFKNVLFNGPDESIISPFQKAIVKTSAQTRRKRAITGEL